MELDALARLLWAAQGVTRSGGGRGVPSAGGLYPLALYVVAGRVCDLPAGIYRNDSVCRRAHRHEAAGAGQGAREQQLIGKVLADRRTAGSA